MSSAMDPRRTFEAARILRNEPTPGRHPRNRSGARPGREPSVACGSMNTARFWPGNRAYGVGAPCLSESESTGKTKPKGATAAGNRAGPREPASTYTRSNSLRPPLAPGPPPTAAPRGATGRCGARTFGVQHGQGLLNTSGLRCAATWTHERLPAAAARGDPGPIGLNAAVASEGITMTLAGLSLLLVGSAPFAVLARLDPTD